MDLHELLNYIEFDYEIENDHIKLIDNLGVYLGDIADFRVKLNDEGVVAEIVDRCSIYWEDYCITPLIDDMEISYNDFNDWKELYELAKEHYKEDVNKNTILYWLVNPNEVIIKERGNAYD